MCSLTTFIYVLKTDNQLGNHDKPERILISFHVDFCNINQNDLIRRNDLFLHECVIWCISKRVIF